MKNSIIISCLTFLMSIMTLGLYAQKDSLENQIISYWRSYDKQGINQFENLKNDYVQYDGLALRVGGAFTQQFQAISHENSSIMEAGEIINPLEELTPGFNLATANLNLDVQLADGVRLNLITYLSSRHHPEAWVKGGFIQFDKMPFLKSAFIDNVMDYVTIKVGHMEINYGDFHFRRTDNGNAIYNPFVGNYIMDAFNTEIGGEIYVKNGPVFGMLGITGGEINGNITEARTSPVDDKQAKSPSWIGKLGYDKQVNEDLRTRITGSIYHTSSSSTNHLYTGDRAGSRYYNVMVEPGGDNFRSGRYSPGFTDQVTAFMGNIFLDAYGFELLGTYEFASGRAHAEDPDEDLRSASQFAADLLYRFGSWDQLYVGGRYNVVTSEDITIDRIQFGAGWFVTKNILAKIEYVNQNYDGFPTGSTFDEGRFNGIMVEASVGF